MAIKDYTYNGLAAGTTLVNNNTTQATALGGTNLIISNGTLATSSDAPTGFNGSLIGTTQSVSGTAYLYETVSATGVLSLSLFWKMQAVGTIGAGLLFVGSGAAPGARVFAFSLLSTEQVRLFDQTGATIFTSTYSGGFVAGQWYRTDFALTVDTTTAANGDMQMATYLWDSNTPLANTSYTSTTFNLGTALITTLRHGTRSATGTADESIGVLLRQDTAAAYMIGAPSLDTVSAGADQVDIEPWSTVTLTATASDGSASWTQISGSPTVTILGSDPLIRTFVAPATFASNTLTFWATNGAAVDAMNVTMLPATDGLVTGAGPTVIPIRFTRVT